MQLRGYRRHSPYDVEAGAIAPGYAWSGGDRREDRDELTFQEVWHRDGEVVNSRLEFQIRWKGGYLH